MKTPTQTSRKSSTRDRNLIHKAVENAPVLICVVNIKTNKYEFVSNSIKQILGYHPEKFLKANYSDLYSFVHPDDRKRVSIENHKALMKANKNKNFNDVITFEYRFKDSKGKWKWLRTDGRVFERDKNGKVVSIINTSLDITKSKKETQKAYAQAQQLHHMADNSNTILLLVNECGEFVYANQYTFSVLGFTPHEFFGKSFIEINKHLTESDFDEIFLHSKEEIISSFETIFVSKDGAEIPLDINISGVEFGKDFYLFVVAQEISQIKILEKQKDEFISNASHELRTPLTSIKAYTQILAQRFEKSSDNLSMQMIERMDGQLNKLSFLINSLLDVSKIERGEILYKPSIFDLNELVEEVVEEMTNLFPQHKITTKLTQSATVYADRLQLKQVFINLITNAIKYSPNGEDIKVKTKRNGLESIACIEDRGLGIPKDKQVHLFERYYKVDGEGHDCYPGMGLGLYLSSEIIKQHKGRIWLSSNEGKGSKFYVALPRKDTYAKN